MAKNGLHLITPTSVSLSGGGFNVGDETITINPNGSVRFSLVTSPGAQVVNVNGVFSSAYSNYIIVLWGKSEVGGSLIQIRVRSAGVDDTTSNAYVTQQLQAASTALNASRYTSSVGYVAQFAGTNRSGSMINIYGPNLASPTSWRSVGVSGRDNSELWNHSGTHNVSSSFDGFSLYSSNPNNFAGLLAVYGMRK